MHVTISSIGIHEGGESGTWHTFDLDPTADYDGDTVSGVDLTKLKGENALEIWSGDISEGEYTKLFIHIDEVTGIPADSEAPLPEIKLPSEKLQITHPFTISNSVVEFVYDITVIKAGQSGMYLIKPQIAESGPHQPFNEVTPAGEDELTIQLADCNTGEVIDGNILPGDEVKVLVTIEVEPVEDANVDVVGMDPMTTDETGLTTCFTVPDEGEIEIKVESGDFEGELEILQLD